MEELLGFLRDVGLGVDKAFEIRDGEARREVEVENLLIEGMVRGDDGDSYTRPGEGDGELAWAVRRCTGASCAS